MALVSAESLVRLLMPTAPLDEDGEPPSTAAILDKLLRTYVWSSGSQAELEASLESVRLDDEVPNTTSSTTDSNANAVRTSFGSSSTCAQRARASDPKLGTSASPIANETNHVHTGASRRTRTTPCRTSSGRSRPGPTASRRRRSAVSYTHLTLPTSDLV